MNLLTSNEQHMTSLEISELLDSRHDIVKKSIERLMERNVISRTPMTILEKINNLGLISKYGIYIFSGENGKRDSIIVVAQLSPEFTAKIVDRWQELEKNKHYIPQTYGDALQLCADQAKQLEAQAPKVNFYDRLADKTSLMTASQIGQKIKISAITLNRHLTDLSVYNTTIKRSKLFQQWFIDKGLCEMKQTELGYSQALFTPKGEQWIFERLTSEGII